MKPSRIFLIIALAAFGIGLLDLGESTFWHALRPFGAVAFVLYFITQLLEKEIALLDQQEREKMESLARHMKSEVPARPARSGYSMTTAGSR